MNSYTHEVLNYDKGIFDRIVDITYIITMENSLKRHTHIYNELKKAQPTKEVIIVYSKVFKDINKHDICGDVDISYKDLMHVVMYIFSISKNKDNILILEDDFIFNKKIKSSDIDSISKFFNKTKPHIYSLGSIHLLSNPLSFIHKRIYIKAGTHAMIYSKIGRSILEKQFKTCIDIKKDIDTLTCFQRKTYGYYKNIYSQIFIKTENRNNWGKQFSYVDMNIIVRFMIMIINIFEMNKKKNIHKKFDNLNLYILTIQRVLILCILFYIISVLFC